MEGSGRACYAPGTLENTTEGSSVRSERPSGRPSPPRFGPRAPNCRARVFREGRGCRVDENAHKSRAMPRAGCQRSERVAADRAEQQTAGKFPCSDKRLSTISSLFAPPAEHSHPRAPCSSAPSRARHPSRTRGEGALPPAAGVSLKPRAASTRNTWMNSVRAAPEKDVSSVSFQTASTRAREASSASARPVPPRPDRALTREPPRDPRRPSRERQPRKPSATRSTWRASAAPWSGSSSSAPRSPILTPTRRPAPGARWAPTPARARATPSSLRTTASSWTRRGFPG